MEAGNPSIFNDVIGPVMRGPSSSHCAAAVRIGRMARDLMGGEISRVLIEFDPDGSLATTHESQGSDMGLYAGFLGWDAADDRMVTAPEMIKEAGIQVEIRIVPFEAPHPNTYRMTLWNQWSSHSMTAISTGGGAVEVIEIDGVSLAMRGDFFEMLVFVDKNKEQDCSRMCEYLETVAEVDEIRLLAGGERQIVEAKMQGFLPPAYVGDLYQMFGAQAVCEIAPVLPILSRQEMEVPFLTCAEMLAYNQDKHLDLGELALIYESARGGIAEGQVLEKMAGILAIMRGAIEEGLAGTEYDDRILGYQSGQFQSEADRGVLLDGGALNLIIPYTTALMESKSAMGLIVAAPTAGACGGLPGAVIGTAEVAGLSREAAVKAMLAGGMIGVFIAAHATFAAEVGGCQAECGAGSGMAAAALVTLAGGSTEQAVNAASIALQNILGMICDPVANRVEVPCLGKNVMAASNALACANMALAGYDPVIPLDEVIQTMDVVGKMIPAALRCTAQGGLSITETSEAIARRLAGN